MVHERKLDAHVFICTNQRDGGESCAQKGSQQLREKVKALSKERPEWENRVRVNASGCLGRCEEGISCVIYPHGRWLTGLTTQSISDVIRAIEEALKP